MPFVTTSTNYVISGCTFANSTTDGINFFTTATGSTTTNTITNATNDWMLLLPAGAWTQEGNTIYLRGGVYTWDWNGVTYTAASGLELGPQPPPLTDEQRRQMEEAAVAERVAYEQQKKEWEIVEQRADELLREILAEDEWRCYMGSGHIDIPSCCRQGVTYRIRKHRRIGIVGVGGLETQSLCIHHPAESAGQFGWPGGDAVAAHVLLCKFNEDHLLRTANRQAYAA